MGDGLSAEILRRAAAGKLRLRCAGHEQRVWRKGAKGILPLVFDAVKADYREFLRLALGQAVEEHVIAERWVVICIGCRVEVVMEGLIALIGSDGGAELLYGNLVANGESGLDRRAFVHYQHLRAGIVFILGEASTLNYARLVLNEGIHAFKAVRSEHGE